MPICCEKEKFQIILPCGHLFCINCLKSTIKEIDFNNFCAICKSQINTFKHI